MSRSTRCCASPDWLGQRAQAGEDLAELEPPLTLWSWSCLKLSQFSWEGRSCARLCPGLVHGPRGPGHKLLCWDLLWWGQTSCDSGIPAPSGCSGCLGWDPPLRGSGSSGGSLRLCLSWALPLGVVGRLCSGLLFVSLLFIYYYVFKLFLQPFLLLSFNCPSSLNTCHLPGGRI